MASSCLENGVSTIFFNDFHWILNDFRQILTCLFDRQLEFSSISRPYTASGFTMAKATSWLVSSSLTPKTGPTTATESRDFSCRRPLAKLKTIVVLPSEMPKTPFVCCQGCRRQPAFAFEL